MRQWSRTAMLAMALAAVFPCVDASGAVHIPLAEDVDFGCGLVERGFYGLGVELLEQRLPKITADVQKRRAYGALAFGNRALARRSRTDLTPAADNARRTAHLKAANKYRELLTKMGGAVAGTLKDLMLLAGQARTLGRELRITPDGPQKDQLLKAMTAEFETVITGIEALRKKAAAAVGKKEEEDDGSLTREKLIAWEKEIIILRGKDVFAGIDLNRVRYWYSKALPASEAAKKMKLLTEAIDGLDDYANSYSEWRYSIIGNEMLARAWMDVGKHEESIRSSEAGLELIRAVVKADPGAKADMGPWRERLLASWILAHGKLGKFNPAIAQGARNRVPRVQLAVAEVMLMKARHYRTKKQAAAAVAVQRSAELSLRALAEKGEPWRTLALQLLDKYDPRGVSFVALYTKFREALRARNNPAVIKVAAQLLALGDKLSADKRSFILARLASVYRQEGMYYEAYTVYRHIALTTKEDKGAETAARRAVGSLKRQHDATKDIVDAELLEATKEWRRKNFKGPGIEHERAVEHKKRREYKDAIERFKLVKKTSLYFESALEQIGECHIFLAKGLQKTKPAEAEKHVETGRQTLLRFLEKIKKPSMLPRVIQRRKRSQGRAHYYLAAIYMRKGKENYKKCLAITKDYIKNFPGSTAFHPYAMGFRLQALVATKQFKQAQVDLVKMLRACAAMKNEAKAGELAAWATDLLSKAHVRATYKLRNEAAAKDAAAVKAAKAENAAAAALRKQAAALRAKATAHANNALRIIMAAIAANPNLPFDKYYHVVAELHFQKRFNELPRYLNLFIDRFGNKKGLTQKQTNKVDGARVILGEAYLESGQFKKAYDVSVKRFDILVKTGKTSSEYWLLQKYIGMSAQRLAKAAKNADEKEKYVAIALDKYLELGSRLKRGSADWWEVTIGAVETQNLAGRHVDNLVVIKRRIATRPGLGGRAFRGRYVRVLEEMYAKLQDKARKAQAFKLLMQIRIADLKQLRKDKKCSEILDVVRSIGTTAADYGGLGNRRKLRVFAIFAMKYAKDEATAKTAERLLKTLKE